MVWFSVCSYTEDPSGDPCAPCCSSSRHPGAPAWPAALVDLPQLQRARQAIRRQPSRHPGAPAWPAALVDLPQLQRARQAIRRQPGRTRSAAGRRSFRRSPAQRAAGRRSFRRSPAQRAAVLRPSRHPGAPAWPAALVDLPQLQRARQAIRRQPGRPDQLPAEDPSGDPRRSVQPSCSPSRHPGAPAHRMI